MQWGLKYNPDTPQKDIVKKMKEDKQGLMKEYMQKLSLQIKK